MGNKEPKPTKPGADLKLEELISPPELHILRRELGILAVETPDDFIREKLQAFLDLDEAGARRTPTFGSFLAPFIEDLIPGRPPE